MTSTKKRIAAALTAAILTTALTVPAMAAETSDEPVRASSCKGSTLEAGERSGLIIGPRVRTTPSLPATRTRWR